LWLGISGAGLLVVASVYLRVSGLPLEGLPLNQSLSGADLHPLWLLIGCLIVVMLPTD